MFKKKKISKQAVKKPPIKAKNKKNISKQVKNGTILQTRDEYLHNDSNYRKPSYGNKGNYRKVAVIDSNRNDELAIVKLHKPNSNNGLLLPSKKHTFRPFVETLDSENNRIKVDNKKFIKNGQKIDKHDVATIKKECFNNPKYRYKNKKKVRRIKGRKK